MWKRKKEFQKKKLKIFQKKKLIYESIKRYLQWKMIEMKKKKKKKTISKTIFFFTVVNYLIQKNFFNYFMA